MVTVVSKITAYLNVAKIINLHSSYGRKNNFCDFVIRQVITNCDNFAVYTNIESYCTSDTNIVFSVNYTSVLKKGKKNCISPSMYYDNYLNMVLYDVIGCRK